MSYRKQIFKLSNLRKLLAEENSCVSLMPTVRLLALPPFFLNDMKSGILYLLNNMLKKYDRSLGGIVIGYQNIKVLMDENTGIIPIGTSETEVNVSVEFYIFQPRIGSYLEGVVNKKSNNHIGCLVHQYFNATILKPDDIDYEDWICKNFNVDDKIIFKVKDLDFTSLLPYIEGVIDDDDNETLLDKDKSNNHINCNTDTLMVNSVTKINENEISCTANFLRTKSEKSDDDFLGMKKDKFYNVEDILSDTIIVGRVDKNHLDKKKKKEKSNDFDRTDQADFATFKNDLKAKPNDLKYDILDKLVQVEDKNSCDFVKSFKEGKEKKRKNKDKKLVFNKTDKCFSSNEVEDSVLYSTLLDSIQSEKMRISFCSPIPQGTPIEKKGSESSSSEGLDSMVQINIEEESSGSDRQSFKKSKKAKKKLKKGKEFFKEKMTADLLEVNKIPKNQKNATDQKGKNSEVQNVLDELFKKEMNRIKDDFKKSDTNSFKEKKEERKEAIINKEEILRERSHLSLYEKLLKEAKSAIDSGRDKLPNVLPIKEFEKNKNKKGSDFSDLSISSSKKKDSKRKKKRNKQKIEHCHQSSNKYRNGSMYVAVATPEKLNPDKSFLSESEQSHASCIKKVKDINGIEAKLEKSLIQNMLGEFRKEERKRFESESDKESLVSLAKQKKKKRKSNQKSQNPVEEEESLYEKLLKEAKSLINSEEQSLPKKKKK